MPLTLSSALANSQYIVDQYGSHFRTWKKKLNCINDIVHCIYNYIYKILNCIYEILNCIYETLICIYEILNCIYEILKYIQNTKFYIQNTKLYIRNTKSYIRNTKYFFFLCHKMASVVTRTSTKKIIATPKSYLCNGCVKIVSTTVYFTWAFVTYF